MSLIHKIVATAGCLLMLAACSSGQNDEKQPESRADAQIQTVDAPKGVDWDHTQLLASMGQWILPSVYPPLVSAAQAMNETSISFCRAPESATLMQLRQQWQQLSTLWADSTALLLEPVLEDNLDYELNDKAKAGIILQQVLKSAEPKIIDIDYLDAVASSRAKGLYTLEYLLFDTDRINPTGPWQQPGAILTLFNNDPLARRRCEYLVSLTGHVRKKVEKIQWRWSAEGGDFIGDLVNAGTTGKIYTTSEQAVEDLFNKFVQSIEQFKNAGLADPMGKKHKGAIKPFLASHWRSQSSLAHSKAQLAALQRVYLGKDYLGQSHYGFYHQLLELDQKILAENISQQFIKTEAALTAINSSLYQSLISDTQPVSAALTEATQLTRLVKHEMSRALGISIGFTSNDGD